MILSTKESILVILVIGAVTLFTRAIAFILFPNADKTPKYITYLGGVLPFAIIGMLIVYCLKGITFLSAPYGLPEIIAVAAVVLLHVWKRNSLLSIGIGTVLYMILVQGVFT